VTITLPNIAFLGKAGAGKSTAADILVNRYSGRYTRLSIAEPLKYVASHIWGPDATKDRGKLQDLGEAVRLIDEDGWINKTLERLEFAAEGQCFVVDDCRFPNEHDALVEAGFVTVRILAGYGTRVSRLRANGKLQDESQLQHKSETALDHVEVKYVIDNTDRTPDEISYELARILNLERW